MTTIPITFNLADLLGAAAAGATVHARLVGSPPLADGSETVLLPDRRSYTMKTDGTQEGAIVPGARYEFWVHAADGRKLDGTTFQATVPAESESVTYKELLQTAASDPGGGETLLQIVQSLLTETYQLLEEKGAANGYASLDADGLVPLEQLPEGIGGGDVVSVNGETGVVVIGIGDIAGLQAALDAKELAANKGQASGYASLDSGGLVPVAQIPAIAISGVTGLTAALAAKEATANKGAANGYAGLNSSGIVPDAQLPTYVSSVAGRAGAVSLAIADVASLQTTLDAKELAANKGTANGYASLDSGGKVPTSQLPASILGGMNFQGTWNATTNSPAIPAASSSNKGYYYKVATAGTTSIDGIAEWAIGDWVVSNGTTWDKVDNSEAVATVAGRTGNVVIAISDLSGLQTALDAKELAANKGQASGYASLDSGTKVPVAQLPVMGGASSGSGGTAGTVPAPSAGDEAKVLSGAGTWVTNGSGGGGSDTLKAALIVQRANTGTDGGSTVAAWQTIPLNSIKYDHTGLGLSLSSGTITLPAGDYRVYYRFVVAPSGVVYALRLQDVTNSTPLPGAEFGGTGDNTNRYHAGMVEFTLASSTTIAMETIMGLGVSGTGFGRAVGLWVSEEIYSMLIIEKV